MNAAKQALADNARARLLAKVAGIEARHFSGEVRRRCGGLRRSWSISKALSVDL
jgi:hypothetical protein